MITHRSTTALKALKALKGPAGLSACVQSALADPDGVSAALLEYGRLTGYPADGCLPVVTQEGKRSWVTAISLARPLDMGLAWERIEQKEDHNDSPTDAGAPILGVSREVWRVIGDLRALDAILIPGRRDDGRATLRVLWAEGTRAPELEARVRALAPEIRRALVLEALHNSTRDAQ